MVLPIQKISVPKKKNTSPTVTSVAWLKNGGGRVLASSSSVDSEIRIWDLRDTRGVLYSADPIMSTHFNRYLFNKPRKHGISCLKVNAQGDRLYAAGMNDQIYEFDTLQMDFIKSYSHPDFDNSSFFVKMDISGCGRITIK